jgi:TonB family protein
VLAPIYDPAPEYPVQARVARLEGSVLVILRVGRDGRPTGLQIVKASPPGVFEGAVRRALMRWRYPVQSGSDTGLTAVYRLSFTVAGVSTSAASVCATATASRTCDNP